MNIFYVKDLSKQSTLGSHLNSAQFKEEAKSHGRGYEDLRHWWLR